MSVIVKQQSAIVIIVFMIIYVYLILRVYLQFEVEVSHEMLLRTGSVSSYRE